ncbi:hypothetical protein [Hymenobacter sediminis]|nr:hypothetical protein [Hymenobacter sediminis]
MQRFSTLLRFFVLFLLLLIGAANRSGMASSISFSEEISAFFRSVQPSNT